MKTLRKIGIILGLINCVFLGFVFGNVYFAPETVSLWTGATIMAGLFTMGLTMAAVLLDY